MNLLVPVLVTRHESGLWRVRPLAELDPPPWDARPGWREAVSISVQGRVLERARAKVVQKLQAALRKVEPALARRWLLGGEVGGERVELAVELGGKRGERAHVRGKFTAACRPAPPELSSGGRLAWLPALGDDPVVHVGPDEDLGEVLGRALRASADAAAASAARVERGESIQWLEVELDGPLVSRAGRRRSPVELLLSGPDPGERRKRKPQELRAAGTLLEVGDELTSLAQDGQLGRAHGRDAEVARALEGLTEGAVRAVVLVGPPGVGKSAVVHEVARRLAERREAARWRGHRGGLFSLSAGRLIAGMRYVGQWEARCLDLLEEARELEAVLHADSLPELVATGRSRSSRTSVAGVLQPFVAEGEVALVAEATEDGLRRAAELDRGFVDLFQVVRLREPTPQETLGIALRALRDLEDRQPLSVDAAALGTSLDLLRRFVPGEAFPGKAVRFLGALADAKGEPAGQVGGRTRIDAGEVLGRFAERFGFARALLDDARPFDPARGAAALEGRIRGQPEAVAALVDVIAVLKAGLRDPDKPVATLLFVGPTGVGKTESAKALAAALFGAEERLLRFDLNECGDAGAVERLAGGPGRPEGTLVRALRERPFSVVLLDEVEKAHEDVLDLLLQLLGEGRLTDALGRTADARGCVFVLTSNLGAELADRDLGFVPEEAGARHVRAVEAFFRPEMVNRFDRVVTFRPLERAHLEAIAAREVEALLRREGAARRGHLVEVAPDLLARLVDAGTDRRFGARPLRRAVERHLAAPLAAAIAARPGDASAALVTIAGRDDGEAAVTVEPLLGTGPFAPGPPPASLRRGAAAAGSLPEQARALAERVEALERSPELAALRSRLGADDGAAAAIEEELLRLRGEVERVLAPLETDDFEVLGAGDGPLRPDWHGAGPGEDRVYIRWLEPAQLRVPGARVHALGLRVLDLEQRLRTSVLPPARVVVHVLGRGGEDGARWARALARLYVELLEPLGACPRLRSRAAGAPGWTEWPRSAEREEAEPPPAREWAVDARAPGLDRWLGREAGLHEAFPDRSPEQRLLRAIFGPAGAGDIGADGGVCGVGVVRAADDEPVERAALRSDAAGQRRVVRKYDAATGRVHDVRLGCTADGRRDMRPALAETLLALAARAEV